MNDRYLSTALVLTLVSPWVFVIGLFITGVQLLRIRSIFEDAKPAPITTGHGWPPADDTLTYYPQKQR